MAFPGTYNFNYYKGDTFEFVIFPKNSDGSAFDMTDFDVAFTISTARGTAGLENRTSSYALVDGNSIICAILPDDSDAWATATSYVYDVEIRRFDPAVDSYEKVYTILTGNISVTEQVTEVDYGAES